MSIRSEDLEKWNSMINSGDYQQIVEGMLYKKISREGNTQDKCPSDKTEVIVHYTGKLLDGTQFDSSVTRNEPFKFNVGLGSVIKGWDQGIPTMCVGEKCELLVHPDFGYGASGSGSIPAMAVLSFDVELLDYNQEDHEYPTEPADKLNAAKIRRDQGKTLFEQKSYQKASKKYEKAAELIEFITDAEFGKEAQFMRAQLLSNISLCFLKLNRNSEAAKKGQEAFDLIEKQSIDDQDLRKKVANRIVRGLVASGNAEQAIEVGEKLLLKIQSEDLSIVSSEITRAKQVVAKHAAERNEMYKKMMGAVKK